jgi:hypothetical protein
VSRHKVTAPGGWSVEVGAQVRFEARTRQVAADTQAQAGQW